MVASDATSHRWSSWAGLAVVAILISGSLALWQPLTSGVDWAHTHHFYKAFLKNAVWRGEIPLWNPYVFLGRPFLADMEVAAFYPPTWLFIVFPESLALGLLVGLHLFFGGEGMRRLVRAWGGGQAPAWLAGVAWMICPPVLAHIQGGLVPFACVLAFWPWMLRDADRLLITPSWRLGCRLALWFGLSFLAGHAQAWWLNGVAVGLYAAPRCLYGEALAALRRTIRGYILLLGAALFGLALAAIQFLPLLKMAAQGNRGQSSMAFAASFPIKWAGLSSLLTVIDPSQTGWWDGHLYVGLAVVALGLLGLARLRDVRMRALAAMSVLCLGLGLGLNTPVFEVVYRLIPGTQNFRFAARFAAYPLFALMIAGACEWRHLVASEGHRRGFALGLIVVAMAGIRWRLGPGMADAPWGALTGIGGLALGAGLLFLGGARRFQLAGLIVAVSWMMDMGFAQRLLAPRYGTITAPGNIRITPKWRQRHSVKSAGVEPVRVFSQMRDVKANSGMVDGFSSVGGNVALCSERVWAYLYLVAGSRLPEFQLTFLDRSVQRKGPFPYKGMDIVVGQAANREFFLDQKASARAWLGTRPISMENWSEALLRFVRGADPHKVTLVEADSFSDLGGSHEGRFEPATVTAFSLNRLTVTLPSALTAPRVLVLAEAWYPGWTARTDKGRRLEIFPVNVWMRGVQVPAGTDSVEFIYRPFSIWLGALISVTAWLVWLKAWRMKRVTNERRTEELRW